MSQTFKSFKEYGDAMGVHPKSKKSTTEKTIKCKICGSEMHRIAGTNIIACTGVSTNKEGKEKPCKNYILTHSVRN